MKRLLVFALIIAAAVFSPVVLPVVSQTPITYTWFMNDTITPDTTFWSPQFSMSGRDMWSIYVTYDSIAVVSNCPQIVPYVGFSGLFNILASDTVRKWIPWDDGATAGPDSISLCTAWLAQLNWKKEAGYGAVIGARKVPLGTATAYYTSSYYDYVRFKFSNPALGDSIWKATCVIVLYKD